MILNLGRRMLRESEPRLVWKFLYNFCYKGMRSVQRFKKRLSEGVHYPAFLYISIVNTCNLRCQGCWVKVDGPRHLIDFENLDRVISEAKEHGNSFFGILGGEPFVHPELMRILGRHRDCYFQVFTNGTLITDDIARELRSLGNVTPLISIEGNPSVSDVRRGGRDVLKRALTGLEHCTNNRLITGVSSSVCRTNIDDLVSEEWLDELIRRRVQYAWFYTYRPVGEDPSFDLALSPEQVLRVRRFVVRMRVRKPIGLVDAYWDDEGRALCPMATGISHHINPWGEIEPCPIIQFAAETIYDNESVYETITKSAYLRDFRETAAQATRGCIVLERPDLVQELVERHGADDTTHRAPGSGKLELSLMESRSSQHNPDNEIPEEHWAYRFAKKHWYFGFGAYS
jgi:MoaA/NifB/PqqE/SkfB family radical SAM enzyme